MFPFQNYFGSGSCSSTDAFLHGEMDGQDLNISSKSTVDTKASAACKSHSEAERRRRARINGHLATLRTLLPNTTKTDKASLLAEVVQHVKELKRLAADVAAQDSDGCEKREWSFPSESDELTLDYSESDELSSSSAIRVSLSCEDRPDLLTDLTQALKSVRARVVKAEMSTVGGRTKSELVIQGRVGIGGHEEELRTLRRTLKAVIDKPAVSVKNQVVRESKRARLSHQFFSYRS